MDRVNTEMTAQVARDERDTQSLIDDDPAMYAWLVMSSTDLGEEIRSERIQAHEKHRGHSMESWHALSPERYLVLAEEVGEVAKEFNAAKVEARTIDRVALRKELIQVAAMASAWVAALDGGSPRVSVGEGDQRG